MKKIMLGALLCGLLPATAQEDKGLSLSVVGNNNALVRVEKPSPIILLPVQESAPMATVRLLSDGRLTETINVPLAGSRVDYFVPVYLNDRQNSDVLLDIRTNYNRTNSRELKDAVWTQELAVADTFDTSNREKFRPAYHHTPQYGWMNDPNGMFYHDGLWHLCYQWNPYGSKWQNLSWGHATSKDLVHWEQHPAPLRPDDLGMVFSGSSVVDHNNTAGFGEDAVVALFTSADASQTQSLAYSNDGGYTFKHFEGNPVIAYEHESRDPNFFWHEPSQKWILTLAAALDHEILIFTSDDLKTWELTSKFGKGYGFQEAEWECPDLMRLKVDGTDEYNKWVMICNINPGNPFGGSGTQYFVGDFDGKTFTAETAPEVTKFLDYGKDHYALVSFWGAPEGRTTAVAWMSNWQYANEVPTQQYRSANSLPRDLSLFKAADGQYYVAVRPSQELRTLRAASKTYKNITASSKKREYALPESGLCEINIAGELKADSKLILELSNAKGEKVTMTFDQTQDSFSMDRRESGLVDFSENFPALTTAPMRSNGKNFSASIFIDRTSIEAFGTEGEFAMTNLVYPDTPYTKLTIRAEGQKAKITQLTLHTLKP